ncbi:hypothetical protein D3C86_2109680 [compost metagenome]
MAGAHAGFAGGAVHEKHQALRLVFFDHRRGRALPLGVGMQQQLQRQGRHLNAGQPVHGTPPCGASRAIAACP